MKHWFKFVVNPLSIIPILFVFHGYFPRVPREINRCFVWTRVSQSPRSLRGRDRWSYTIVRCKGRDVRNGIHSNHRVSRDNKEFFELIGILVSIRSARVYIYIYGKIRTLGNLSRRSLTTHARERIRRWLATMRLENRLGHLAPRRQKYQGCEGLLYTCNVLNSCPPMTIFYSRFLALRLRKFRIDDVR